MLYASASDIYDSPPSFSPYYAGSVKKSVLNDALSELNYIRHLIGVPDSVVLDDEYTNKAQHGAVLLDAIDRMTHTPSKPLDMSDSFYELGYDATTHGNVAYSTGEITLKLSTKLFMYDSDSSNVSALGHRRWLMNPRMKRVGFGISTRRGYEVTYVIDEDEGNSSWPISDSFITWPANKFPHHLEYMEADTAWSVTLNQEIFNEPSYDSVSVRLTRTNDGTVWELNRNSDDGFFNVNTQGYAYDPCIIFRPKSITGYNDGETWRVEISGLTLKDGGTGNISYTVTFTGEATGYEENTPHSGDGNSNNTSGGGGCNTMPLAVCVVVAFFTSGIPRSKNMCAGKKYNFRR